MAINRIKVEVTADANGDATAYSNAVRGKILKIDLVYDSGMSANCKTEVVAEKI